MPLTNGHAAYAALHEKGLNTLIDHVFNVRRYYFHYAVPPLGSGAPGIDFTVLSPLPMPIGGSALAYSMDLSRPILDFTPQDPNLSLPPPLTLGPNQFSLFMESVEICLLCGMKIPFDDFRVPLSDLNVLARRDSPQFRPGRPRPPRPDIVCAKLQVWAVGHPTVIPLNPTDSLLGLEIDDIVIKEVCDLEPIMECLLKNIANALLDELQFTLTRIALGAFPLGLILGDGPQISDDQLKVWAEIV